MFGQDIRYALRTLPRSPVFTVTVVLSLALGIGANTAIFSLIYALLLRQLPVPDPHELVQLQIIESGRPTDNLSYPAIRALAAEEGLFAGVGGFSGWTFNVGPPDSSERRRGVLVSGQYYQALGVKAALGRLLTAADDRMGSPAVAVITFDHWRQGFNADPSAVGRSVLLDGKPVLVVGVSERGFTGASVGEAMDFTLPLAALPQMFPGGERRLEANARWIRVLARLAPGISVEQANARLQALWPPLAETALTASMAEQQRDAIRNSTLQAVFGGAGWSNLRSAFQRPLYVLFAMVGLILLISCGNAANLFLARATARKEELALRGALGATRPRIIRQLLTESVLLALLAAAVGVALAYSGSRALVAWISEGRPSPVALDLAPDATILAFTVALTALTGVLFGLAPAVRVFSTDFSTALRASARTGGARSPLQSWLVTAQIALSLTLLIGAGLFVGTLEHLSRLDPGFRHEGVLMMDLDARRAGLKSGGLAEVYRELLTDLSAIPGVAAATLSADTPLSGRTFQDAISVDGRASTRGDTAQLNRVAPEYFRTLGTRLILGRDFTVRDRPGFPLVAIVNQTFVRRYLDGESPLGRFVSLPGSPDKKGMAIVGVVEDALLNSLRSPPPPSVYLPALQYPDDLAGATFSVAASGSLADISAEMRRIAALRAPSTLPNVRPFSEQVGRTLSQERLLANLAAAFGALALILALSGLYGLQAYATARRKREIGIRMALGASGGTILRSVLADAARLIGVGVLLGLAAAWVAARWVSTLLFGLTASDPVTILAATGLMMACGLAAGFLPAVRAARANPISALKYD